MTSLKDKDDYIYSECDHIKRVKPDFAVNEDIAKEIGGNYRTLPAFEQGLYDHVLTRHYSLQRNQLLDCRWEEYKRHVEGRVFAPFQFPDKRDLHFHDCAIRFMPSESVHRSSMDHKKRLKPGPGVDFRGQMPIPIECMMKRGDYKKEEIKEKHSVQKKKDFKVKKLQRGR